MKDTNSMLQANTHAAGTINLAASTSLIGLVVLCTLWELLLAPLRPGGSWLVLKTLPLLAALFGILRARRYTHQWVSMLALAYFMEGIVRTWSEQGMNQILAATEITLSLILFSSCIAYARLTRPSNKTADTGAGR